MKKLIPRSARKILSLIVLAGIALTGLSGADDVQFFEKKYRKEIKGVKPIEEERKLAQNTRGTTC